MYYFQELGFIQKRTNERFENLKIVKNKNVYLRKLCVSFPLRRQQRKKTINFILQIIPFYSFFLQNKKKCCHVSDIIIELLNPDSRYVCVGVCFGHGFILTTYVSTTTRIVNKIQRKLILQATTKR